jgi:hypothetical protein
LLIVDDGAAVPENSVSACDRSASATFATPTGR